MKQLRSLGALLLGSLLMLHGVNSYAQAKPMAPNEAQPAQNAAAPQAAGAASMGEDPGPVYTRLVKEWADTTRFAQNSAEVTVGQLKIDMQNDPQLQKIISKALLADLQQFFYELYISPETIQNLAKVYAQFFTLDEMQALNAFYHSPLGQKLVKANPELTIKTQQMGLALLKEHEKGYLQIIAKYLKGQQSPEQQAQPKK